MSHPQSEMGPMSIDAVIDALGQRHWGVVEHAELMKAGVALTELEWRLKRGSLIPLEHGVYRIGGAVRTWHQSMAAACLAAGPEAVASHRAAVRLWGLGYPNASLELSVPYSQCPKPRAVKLHRSTDLEPAHVTVRERLPVTKPARTLLDLGAVARFDAVADLVEVAIVRRLVTVAGLQTVVDQVARKGRRGCGVLRAVLDQRPLGLQRCESVVESFFARMVSEFGVTGVMYQHEVEVRGRTRRLDFAVPDALVGIEIDSEEHHSSPAARVSDRQRQNEMATVGYLLLRYGSIELRRSPMRVLGEIASVVAERRRLLCSSKPV